MTQTYRLTRRGRIAKRTIQFAAILAVNLIVLAIFAYAIAAYAIQAIR